MRAFSMVAAAALLAGPGLAQSEPPAPLGVAPSDPAAMASPAAEPAPAQREAPKPDRPVTKKVSGVLVGGAAAGGAVAGGLAGSGLGCCLSLVPLGGLIAGPLSCLLCGTGAGAGAYGGLMIEGVDVDWPTVGAAAGAAVAGSVLTSAAAIGLTLALTSSTDVNVADLTAVEEKLLVPLAAVTIGGNVLTLGAVALTAGLLAPAEAPVKGAQPESGSAAPPPSASTSASTSASAPAATPASPSAVSTTPTEGTSLGY